MKVFYRPEQNTDAANSFSPSAGKPRLVVEDWLAKGLIKEKDVMSFKPLDVATICLAHDRDYVNGVRGGSIPNGFGNTNMQVANTLPYTTGSFLAAAEYALKHNTHAISPTSGFHHAGFRGGAGFCTFNGLMIAALHLQKTGQAKTIGILDLDMHYGNGTDDIIHTLRAKGIAHRTAGKHFHDVADAGGKLAEDYFDWLENAISEMTHCDIVFYQAGADCHIRDPLGGYLTTKLMMVREEQVICRLAHKPMVINLAGGYQRDAEGTIEPVLKLHRLIPKTYHSNVALFKGRD